MAFNHKRGDFLASIYWIFSLFSLLKDVRGWQILTMKAAETLCIVCLPLTFPEKIFG